MRTKPSIRLFSFFKCRGQWSILFWRQRTKAVRLINIILFAIYLQHFIAWCYSRKNPLYSKILVTRFIAPSYTPLPCGIIPHSLIAIRHWFWETLKLKTIHKRRENVIYRDRSNIVELLLQLENKQQIMQNNVETQHNRINSIYIGCL